MAPLTLEEAPSANGRSLSRCACWLGSLQQGLCVAPVQLQQLHSATHLDWSSPDIRGCLHLQEQLHHHLPADMIA